MISSSATPYVLIAFLLVAAIAALGATAVAAAHAALSLLVP